MPQVIPVIVSGLGTIAGLSATTVAWLTIASTVTVGLYEQDRAKSKAREARDAYNESLQDRILTVRSAVAAREYILGTVRKGGTLVYADTVGADKTSLDSVTAICCNQTELVGYYIGDEYITPADFPGDKYGQLEVQSQKDTFEHIDGPSAELELIYTPISSTVRAFYQLNRAKIEISVDSVVGNVVNVSGISGNNRTVYIHYDANAGQKLRIQFKNGSTEQEVTDWDVATTPQWTAEHRLRGVTHIRTLMLWDESIFTNGAPPISGVFRGLAVDGHPFYDPRTDTNPDYTDNPALLSAWYMTLPRRLGGCGIPSSWINWTWVSAAANVCDELISVRMLETPEVFEQIKRYQCHTVISTARDPIQNLQMIMSAMSGRYVFTAGEYRIVAGAFRPATRTLTDDDIAADEDMQVLTIGGEDDPPNVVTAQFSDSAKNWAETSPPAVRNPDYIDADGAEQPLDVKLPATTDARQANYLQGVLLESKRPAFGASVPVNGIGEDIAIFDCVQLNLAGRPTYSGKTFEVLSTIDYWNGKFRLTLAEIRPQTWALDAERFTPSDPIVPPDLSYLWNVTPITGLAVELGDPQILPDGNAITQVTLTWGTPSALYIGSGGRIEIRYGEAGGEWISVAPVPGDATGTTITASLIEGSSYQFQVRVINSIGAASRWTGVWTEVEGSELAVGVAGPGIFTWTNPIGVSTTSSSVTKTAGAAAWDAGAHSLQSYSGGSFVSMRCGQLGTRRMIGLNGDPAIDAGYLGIDYAVHLRQDNTLAIYESGILISTHGSYTADTIIAIKYDNASVTYERDGIVIRSVPVGENRRFFMDTSLFEIGSTMVDIAFGPMGGIGPQGLPGVAAQSIRLSAQSYAFTFSSSGAASPAGQSIIFTAVRQNIATATVWSTTASDGGAVTLTGSGDTRTLTVNNFGSRTWVRVRVESSGFVDEVTVARLTQGATGAAGTTAFLTNENHTLAANPDGVIGSYAGANGQLFVYEGTNNVTASATLSVVSTIGCTVQLNAVANSPIPSSPKGTYRVTEVTADQAQAVFRAVYGSFTADLPMTITRARQGQPGDGQNLLPIGDWVVGTTGSQGPSNRWLANGPTAENAIVLGGGGTAPPGPYGTSEVLWECRPNGGGPTDEGGDGGWDIAVAIDHRRTYRSVVWFRVTQLSGNFYHGCSRSNQTLNLSGSLNTNPYFVGFALAGSGLMPDKWYLSVGIIHGSGYTGGYSGIGGIYDAESGRRVVQGTEFKNVSDISAQTHRCYHFYDPSATSRQWMPKPRLEEVNGSEPTLDSLLGFQRSTPWIEAGDCYASTTSFYKVGGASAWGADAVRSALSYRACHLQFKAGTTFGYFMVGINSDPASDSNYTSIDFAWYCNAGGALQIYESGAFIGDFGTYSANTELAITFDGASVRYYRDRLLIRGPIAAAGVPYGLDSSFYTPGAQANSVRFGPGIEFETISTGDIVPGAATEVFSGAFAPNSGGAGSAGNAFLIFTPTADGICEVTGTSMAYTPNQAADGNNSTVDTVGIFNQNPFALIGAQTYMTFGRFQYSFQSAFLVTQGTQYQLGIRASSNGSGTYSLVVGNATLRATVVKR